MRNLLDSILLIRSYNQKSLKEVADEFAELSYQPISDEIIKEFHFTGLNNIDFLKSDFLNQYGLQNLFQYYETQEMLNEVERLNEEEDRLNK